MEATLAKFLISESGLLAVERAEELIHKRVDILAGITNLRKSLDADQAREVWKLAELRRKAVDKLGADLAKDILTDQDGYEMSSGTSAAAYHAGLLSAKGVSSVLDLCAGVGVDTLAFAAANISVTAYEADPGRALLLSENVIRAGYSDRVTIINEDVTVATLAMADAAYFDPARRSGHQKWAANEEQTVPPLSFINKVQSAGIANILVKLSPAVNRNVIESYPGQLTFLSAKGECKEALLSLGNLSNGSAISAVLLPTQNVFSAEPYTEISPSHGSYLWEPDPAVIRAGLTGALAKSLGGWQCDAHTDYFFTNSYREASPFAVCYKVLADQPYSRRGLQQILDGINRVVLKQRGFPLSNEEVLQKLNLPKGKREAIVVLAGFCGENFSLIVERVSITGQEDPI